MNAYHIKNASEMEEFIKLNKIELIDACFCDPLGTWHHCSFAKDAVDETDLVKGFAFDGSSIRLFSNIEKSDLVMIPDPTTCWIDPFQEEKRVLHVCCDVKTPEGKVYNRCPRTIAKTAREYMVELGFADTAIFGPEAEFFMFDDVTYSVSPNTCSFSVNGVDGFWNSDAKSGNNLAHRNQAKHSYFPCAPQDPFVHIRSEMLLTMGSIGIPIEKHHHEVAACQHELGYKCQEIVKCADSMMSYKYVVKNVAAKHRKTATFMPKPLYGENGSGMHCHQSLWKNGVNLFYDENGSYEKLSELAIFYIGGLLHHSAALLAICSPTTNSYKRLTPGYEAPTALTYSSGNRSAAVRIPLMDGNIPKMKRVEYRCPDGASCPYLAFAACLMAGLDGIKKKIHPGKPLDCNIYESNETVPSTPATLSMALDALETDNEFLQPAFSKEFLEVYIKHKREECKKHERVPSAVEYEMYYTC